MKRLRDIAMRTLPVCLAIVLTLLLTSNVFRQMISAETERCWAVLEDSTQGVADEIHTRFQDNATMLALAADAIAMKANTSAPEVISYLAAVQKRTMFDRINVLYPDDTILTAAGERIDVRAYTTFEQLIAWKEPFSRRITDGLTGREVLYCVMPIVQEETEVGVLIGVLNCETLHEQFHTSLYEETAQLFLIDCNNGAYLMDNWHPTLGNLHDLGPREMLPGYENIDFASEMLAGKTNMVSFRSKTNGQVSYQYYMPVKGFSWSLAMVVQDEQVFANVDALRRDLNGIGMAVMFLLILYLGWNVYLTFSAVEDRYKVQHLEQEQITSEAKNRFMANISHDIRTPLNGIIGTVDILRRHGDDPVQLESSLSKIDVSAKYLLTLVSDMLELNEMENGRIELTSEPIDIYQLGNDLAAIMQPKAQDADVAYHTIYGKIEHPYVLGSLLHVERVLLNIISNAIKYNRPNGEVWVTIDEKECAEDLVTYRFEVRDTGVGMTEKFQAAMFAAFEQEDAGARTRYRGYGLGLPIVKNLVTAMKGEILVDSRPDMGSTFTVTLPFRADASRTVAREMLKEVFHPEQDLSGAHLLVAEDNELNMEIAEALLMDAGARVTRASNGREAVDLFLGNAPWTYDAILMDIMMPEMDGCEATRAIRQMTRPDAKTVPILAMTALSFAEDIQRCREAGMNEHIAKPLDAGALVRRVAAQLHRGSDGACAQPPAAERTIQT